MKLHSSYNRKDSKTMFQAKTMTKYVGSDFTKLQHTQSQMKLIFVCKIKRYSISLEQRQKKTKKTKLNSKNIYCDIKFAAEW